MNNFIPIVLQPLSNNYQSMEKLINIIKSSRNSMILVSKTCYSMFKSSSSYIGNYTNNRCCTKKFVYNKSNAPSLCCSIIPIYDGTWFYLESIYDGVSSLSNSKEIPKSITFVYFKNEYTNSKVQSIILSPPLNDCPVDCIMNHNNNFSNSIFILTSSAYDRLVKSTSLVSTYCGTLRLEWKYDDYYEYEGGTITLKALNKSNKYLIESMNFSMFNKTYTVTNLPQNVFFIV